jgi:hypothetical protein
MCLAWKRKKLEKGGLKLSTKFQKRSECKTFCYNVIYIKPEKTLELKISIFQVEKCMVLG